MASTFSLFSSKEESFHYPTIKTLDKIYSDEGDVGKAEIKKDILTIIKRVYGKENVNFSIHNEYKLTNQEKEK